MESPDGEWTDEELYKMLGDLYEFIFLETDPAKELEVEAKARKYADDILRVVKANLRAVSGGRVRYISSATPFGGIANECT